MEPIVDIEEYKDPCGDCMGEAGCCEPEEELDMENPWNVRDPNHEELMTACEVMKVAYQAMQLFPEIVWKRHEAVDNFVGTIRSEMEELHEWLMKETGQLEGG